ncbi:hypothetical protein HII31_09227 [Pseudocercospora fuligena]|uniref:Uncharacterized protein n=1 Tax=Pseudocercospora fuligena TaxID=685502 RepID=A0A8H6RFA0_9PEZI|nr:hypothetical protein HII31_09227 [Pseudocercospora fuligena]
MPRQRNVALPYNHEAMNSRLDEMNAVGTITPTAFNRFYRIALYHDKLDATQDSTEQTRRHNLVYGQLESKFKESYDRKPTWSSSRASFMKEAVALFLRGDHEEKEEASSASPPPPPLPPLKPTAPRDDDAPMSDVPEDREGSIDSATPSQMSRIDAPSDDDAGGGGGESYETWTSRLIGMNDRLRDDPKNQRLMNTYMGYVKQYADWLMDRENQFRRLSADEEQKYHDRIEELKTRELALEDAEVELQAKQVEGENRLDRERKSMAKEQREINARAQLVKEINDLKEKNANLAYDLEESRTAEANLAEDVRQLETEKDLAKTKALKLQSELSLKNSGLQSEVTRLQEENSKAQEVNAVLKEALEKDTKTISSLQAEASKLRKKSSGHTTDAKTKRKLDDLEQENSRLLEVEIDLTNDVQQLQNQISDLDEQVSEKNSELTTLQQSLAKLSESHDLMKQKLSAPRRKSAPRKDELQLPPLFIPAHVQARVEHLKANGTEEEVLQFKNEVVQLASVRQLSAASIERKLEKGLVVPAARELWNLVKEVVEVLEGVDGM